MSAHKELNCLYAIEESVSHEDVPLGEILRGVVQAVPSGWQYADVCRARITYGGQVYESAEFAETPWVQHAPICVQAEPVGALEVFYIEHMPDADEGPFLQSECKLVEAATRLGRPGRCTFRPTAGNPPGAALFNRRSQHPPAGIVLSRFDLGRSSRQGWVSRRLSVIATRSAARTFDSASSTRKSKKSSSRTGMTCVGAGRLDSVL
jgi:hypothetical protein